MILRFILLRLLVAAATVGVALALASAAFAAPPPPRPGPPARPSPPATCAETVRVRPSDGALVTHWVCVVSPRPVPAPR